MLGLGLVVYLLVRETLSGWRFWLLLLLAVDIGAGGVANFTQDTTDYWAKHPKYRLYFIAVHLIHLLIIWLAFPEEKTIWTIGGIILLFTWLVNSIRKEAGQRIAAGSLVLISLMALTLTEMSTIPELLLYAMSIKLILGFAVRWNYEET